MYLLKDMMIYCEIFQFCQEEDKNKNTQKEKQF